MERALRSLERIRNAIASPGTRDSRRRDPAPEALTPEVLKDLLESQLTARHLDLAALELRSAGRGHYTITSAGHEGNVVLGRLSRPSDPTLLHYRSAAMVVERARQVPGIDVVRDIVLSLQASREDPASGGRHKVFGRRELGIIPKTSTIASHLPRAVGLAFGLEHRRKLKLPWDRHAMEEDAIVCASFGDAAINHSTWLGAVNAAAWAVHRGVLLPLLLVCEDNGLGLSVRSPRGWVESRLATLAHVRYFHAQGWDLPGTWQAAEQAVAWCRRERRPAVLHLECARLLPHAGSDLDTVYRSPKEIDLAESRDPVRRTVELALDMALLSASEVAALEREVEARVATAVRDTISTELLGSREEIAAPLGRPVPAYRRERTIEPDTGDVLTLAQGLNAALAALMEEHPQALLFGEDVARKGGVFGVTRGLRERFGPLRVFDTLLDEQHVLGLALGTSMLGVLPVAEIQYLAFLHNAEDQLRGEAALLPYLSGGAYDNPLVVRIASMATPNGVGGSFHNENSLAVLRDVPGLVVVVPARADDAGELVAAAWRLALEARRVVVIVEPIPLYHERDLYARGDRAWLAPMATEPAPWNQPRLYDPEGKDLCIASYGLGVRRSLRVARRLREEHELHARVLDLRWISPLPTDSLLDHARDTGNLLVVDEARRTGSVSEGIAAAALDARWPCRFARVTSADCPVPLGPAAACILPSEDEILTAALRLIGG